MITMSSKDLAYAIAEIAEGGDPVVTVSQLSEMIAKGYIEWSVSDKEFALSSKGDRLWQKIAGNPNFDPEYEPFVRVDSPELSR